MQTVIDTGPLVALIDARDRYHPWAVEAARSMNRPLHSCEAVVTESHFLLRDVHDGQAKLNALLSKGRVVLDFSAQAHIAEIEQLMARFANVPMSFADACVVRQAEYPSARVFTLDSDFSIYRMTNGKRLHLVCP